jgi:hypothetical protein
LKEKGYVPEVTITSPTVVYVLFIFSEELHLISGPEILLPTFQESLKYRLLGSEGDIGSWGHEYVRYAQN